jgi:Rrf2 family protein
MAEIFKATEAVNLALHSMAVLYVSEGVSRNTRELSLIINASSNHLSKILLKLVKAGLVMSIRGPSGGFMLSKDADQITLKEIYEAIEGPLTVSKCFFKIESCQGVACALGAFSRNISEQFEEKLKKTKLSQLDFQINLLTVEKDNKYLKGTKK